MKRLKEEKKERNNGIVFANQQNLWALLSGFADFNRLPKIPHNNRWYVFRKLLTTTKKLKQPHLLYRYKLYKRAKKNFYNTSKFTTDLPLQKKIYNKQQEFLQFLSSFYKETNKHLFIFIQIKIWQFLR